MYNTKVLTTFDELISLKNEWNQLVKNSHSNTIFLTWEWIYTWWNVFGKDAALFIITVQNSDGELIGIAPLFIRRAHYYKLPVKEMTIIGIGHSDRQDFIISKSNSGALHEIIRVIQENTSKWDIVNLEQIPNDSLLTNTRFNTITSESETSSVCPYISILSSWEIYYKSLSKKFRRDIKHKQNRLTKHGNWEFKVQRKVQNINAVIQAMVHIEAKSRKHSSNKAFFLKADNIPFLVEFCKICLEKDWFDLSSLILDDKRIAYLLGFIYNNKYYAYNMTFLEEFHDSSPGKLLLNEKIKWCFENNFTVKKFDFLRGDHYIKSKWTSDNRNHARIVFFKSSLYSRGLKYAVFHLRPRIKKLKKKTI